MDGVGLVCGFFYFYLGLFGLIVDVLFDWLILCVGDLVLDVV